jgi:phosphate transport system protein
VKLPRPDINLYKVIIGVGFSLVWARVMYLLWDQPSFISFIWFYLGIGSIVLKWVLFAITDRIYTALRLKAVKKELNESIMRAEEASKVSYEAKDLQIAINHEAHTRLEDKLIQLERNIFALGNMVEKALEHAITSLKKQDIPLARQIIKRDKSLDYAEFSVREDCLRLISDSHPKDNELRRVVAMLGIITELERMGDYAEGIANITLMIGTEALIKRRTDISKMKQVCVKMLQGSMESLLDKNIEKAKHICQMDDDVDSLNDKIFRELILQMIKDPESITRATRLIWVVHNLERFADRATNICEYVVYSATGEMVDIGASKY